MKLLLTGANGYIGLRLLPSLLRAGHEVWGLVRDRNRFPTEDFEDQEQFHLIEGDLLDLESLPELPGEFDAAYYLVHSMGGSSEDFTSPEAQSATNFAKWIGKSGRCIYLSGLSSEDSDKLSTHMRSRQAVEEILRENGPPLTVLRASIIVGSGSASFEIIRDLVEKLPVMVCPKWTQSRCQPIAIRNVIEYLTGLLEHPESAEKTYDIGGEERLTYRELLTDYAAERGLRRYVIPVPFLSPKLSSYWLYFVTSTSFPLAQALVGSLKCESICREESIRDLIPTRLLPYREAIQLAFARIAQNRVPSSWIDSLSSGLLPAKDWRVVQVPQHGVLVDQQRKPLKGNREDSIEAVWSLGGKGGWPSMNWAWKIRGFLDKFFGGIGIRRGRRHPTELRAGDALDFWRVLLADREQGRLILYAEMKMPGEAWLEFRVSEDHVRQIATFRPQGLFGRLYWYAVLPFHWILFPQMAARLAAPEKRKSAPSA